jgi:integrase/recombinase XerD
VVLEGWVEGYRAFLVRLPSGVRYWTVVDSAFRVHEAADGFLLHMRLGRDLAESSTRAYAISLALFFGWCSGTGLEWQRAPQALGRFVHWLRYHDAGRAGPPDLSRPVRGERRVNCVLAAVREFFRHAVSAGLAGQGTLRALFEVADERSLPAEARGEALVDARLRPRHRLREPEGRVEAISDEDILELLRACRSARDRFIVLALWRIGLRRGELAGLRREDVHLVPDATRLGCGVKGPHVHVRRRDNPNGAAAKSRRSRAVPADWLAVQAYDQYMSDRDACPAAQSCDFLLVNLARGRVGGPMRPGALNELMEALSERAGLGRRVRPHMARHSFATNVSASGATLDEIRDLLGHQSFTASAVYLHPGHERLREAVDRVPVPRDSPHEVLR